MGNVATHAWFAETSGGLLGKHYSCRTNIVPVDPGTLQRSETLRPTPTTVVHRSYGGSRPCSVDA